MPGETFELPVAAGGPGAASPDIVTPGSVPIPATPGPGAPAPSTSGSAAESGRQVAEHLSAADYQPVILFGNAASGKTSMVLSLLAVTKTQASLEAGCALGQPLLDTATTYGGFMWDQAQQFYNQKLQQFIAGTAAPATNVPLPFFLPIIFQPKDKPEVRLAFMESNGEWFRPDLSKATVFEALPEQLQDFIRHFDSGILFIHLLPYTQRRLYSASTGGGSEAEALSNASLAVANAIEVYGAIRPDKSADRHLVLVTKWDAHRSGESGADAVDDLADEPAAVQAFVSKHYAQVVAALRALNLDATQVAMNGYCAGQIAGDTIIAVTASDPRGEAMRRFPKGVWRWLYRETLARSAGFVTDPFPAPPAHPLAAFGRWLNRLF